MQYACIVYQDEKMIEAMSDAELEAMVSECISYIGELSERGQHVMSAGLMSVRSATTIRRQNAGTSVTDGPFAETKECLGGLTIIEARDLTEAIQIASKFPMYRAGCIEVRPVVNPMEEPVDPYDRRLVSAIRRAVESSPNCQDAAEHFVNTAS